MPHWKKSFNPDYLGAYSLEDGQELILTLKSVKSESVTGDKGRKEDLLVARFAENVKPMILNKTNCKIIQQIYKTPDTDKWVGKQIQVYATTTPFGGEVVECLRIRPKIPVKEEEIVCEECGKNIKPAYSMTVSQLAKFTTGKYGRKLCADCATKEAQKIKEQEKETQEGEE